MSLSVDITKKLPDFTLETAFAVEDGTLGLLGSSGSGKSMTLKCIAGLIRPDTGRIVLDGRVLFDSAAGIDLPPQRRRTGYLFQNYALFPHMTVAQNIRCGMRSNGGQMGSVNWCSSSIWKGWKIAIRHSSQAVSSSAPPWRASWRPNRPSSCWMNRFLLWTPACGRRCSRQ